MTAEDKIRLESSYNSLMGKPNKVYEIFCDYFGEDKVDMQGFKTLEEYMDDGEEDSVTLFEPFILVYFPTITVRNEHDRSIDIQDVYIKIPINLDGEMRSSFYINRATYSIVQFYSEYLHSHCPSLSKTNARRFNSMCLGNGPIKDTMANLRADYDEDLWQLFCSELEDYLQTESLTGGPYKHLEQVKNPGLRSLADPRFKFYVNSKYTPIISSTSHSLILDFTRFVLKEGGLPLGYVNNIYSLGMSYLDCTIYLSNKFIEWFNREDNPYRRVFTFQQLLEESILIQCVIDNGRIYRSVLSELTLELHNYEGAEVCVFKGRTIHRHIEAAAPSEISYSALLNNQIVEDIVAAIIKIVNYRYGRQEEFHSKTCGETLYL